MDERLCPEPLEVSDALTGETVFLGPNSAPAFFLRSLGQENPYASPGHEKARDLVQGNILSIFGLENSSVTYPFVSLWSTNDSSSDDVDSLREALPSDMEILKAFRQYRSTSYLYYPPILDLAEFEVEMYGFLSQREAHSRNNPMDTASLHGKGFAWIGTLYAMLAAAAQFNDNSIEERGLASRVFVCLSFQCLRLTNFFKRPSVQSVQTMLLIGNVLQNDMNPGVAWILLGMTIRSAQSIGLHSSSVRSQSTESLSRRGLWRATAWQDTILSLSHDRPTTTFPAVPTLNDTILSSNASYEDSLSSLCPVIHAICSMRVSSPETSSHLSSIESICGILDAVHEKSKPSLQMFEKCMTRSEYGEHLALKFNLAYAKSELCRPIMETCLKDVESQWSLRVQKLQLLFVSAAWDTIHAFLDMRQFDSKLVRTWAAKHRVLSTSLVLGLLTPEVRWMDSMQRKGRSDPLERLIPVLEELEVESRPVSSDGHKDAYELESGPLTKAVEVLKALMGL